MVRTLVAAMMMLALPAAAAPPATPAPVEVMVLGTYHFGNPGLDVNNIKVDSVLTPRRQAELQAVGKALAAFRPTRVMVERQSNAPDLADPGYDGFNDAMLTTQANEIVQIGYRTARLAGVKTVNAIDEQPEGSEPDYFPYDKLQAAAAATGQGAALVATDAPIVAEIKAFETAQPTSSVAALLARLNRPGSPTAGMDTYYAKLPFGDFDSQPGADLNAMWYLRNAKIFGKLMKVARPGDRVLVVYGAGHGFWLRHFASLTPGYRSVDVLPYLGKVGSTPSVK